MQLRQKDYELADELLEKKSSELLYPLDASECTRSLIALDMWITEHSESKIAGALKAESGDVHRMNETARWLAFCMRELSRHLERPDLAAEMESLELRIRHGVKAQLLDLVRVRGIGRVRARILYRGGIKKIEDLENMPLAKLAAIDKIGSKLAASIKSQTSKFGSYR